MQQLETATAGLHSASDLSVAGPVLLAPQGRGQTEVRVLPQALVPLLHICLRSLGLQQQHDEAWEVSLLVQIGRAASLGACVGPGNMHELLGAVDTSMQLGEGETRWRPVCVMWAVV